MLYQIIIGSVLIIATIAIEVICIEIAIKSLTRFGTRLTHNLKTGVFMIVLMATTLWLLFALTLATWLWSIAFVMLGAFDTLETALYFSMVAFTTLGFGDLVLPQDLRLLSGFIAANGLVLFGLNTAFIVAVMSRFRGDNT